MAVFGYQVAGFGAGADDVAPQEITVDAIDFNGTNSQIQYANNVFRYTDPPDSDDPGTGSTHTISFWIKPETISTGTLLNYYGIGYGIIPNNRWDKVVYVNR